MSGTEARVDGFLHFYDLQKRKSPCYKCNLLYVLIKALTENSKRKQELYNIPQYLFSVAYFGHFLILHSFFFILSNYW
jgi:hypothetical protein